MTDPKLVERICEQCGETYFDKERRRGRPRRWDKRSCRDKAYKTRKALASSTEVPSAQA